MDENNFNDGRKIVSIIVKAITNRFDTIMKFLKRKTSSTIKILKQFSLYVLKMQEEAKWRKDFLKNMLQMDLKH